MTRYLISFPAGAMTVPEEELPDVGRAAHAVVQEAKDAGVLVFAGGLLEDVVPVMVDLDGTVSHDTYPQTKGFGGGLSIVDVPSREEAVQWAARLAAACRCAQEVRPFGQDAEV